MVNGDTNVVGKGEHDWRKIRGTLLNRWECAKCGRIVRGAEKRVQTACPK